MNRLKHSILLALSFLVVFNTTAQQNDFAAWGYLQLKLKLNQKWNVGFTEHHLRNENATEKWMNIHDLFVAQKINHFLSHEFHIRSVQYRHINNQIEDRTLFYYVIEAQRKIDKWQLSMRSRWQQLTYGDHWNDAFKGPYYYHRLKLSLSYAMNYHWKIGCASELFQPLNRPNRALFDQIRYGVSINHRLNQHLMLNLFYQIQQPLSRSNPRNYFVFGTGIHLTL